MIQDIDHIMLNEEEIAARTAELAKRISDDYRDKYPILICTLKGAVVFFGELVKRIDTHCSFGFITASSYRDATVSSGAVEIKSNLTESLEGREVIIIEDIIDSGKTLVKITEMLSTCGAKSVEICTLLDKPARRDRDVTLKPKYCGFTIKDEFVVGYGLDYAEKYRNLPFVGVLKPEIYNS